MKNKKITYILLGVLLLLLGAVTYLIIINKDSKEKPLPQEKEKPQEEEKLLSYVSCKGSAALLNVRNSVSGDIIDGLSCYQIVEVEEELEKNEACDKWYKINYKKRNNTYTGYACGTYINKEKVKESEITKARELIDKVLDYYTQTKEKPYCGKTQAAKEIEVTKEDGSKEKLPYVKSEYTSLEDIKKYLSSFSDISIYKTELKLSDINNPKKNDDYYEIDNSLYCRDYSDKVTNNYTGSYNIEITLESNDKQEINISYEYLKEDSKCEKDLTKCPNSNFKYEIGKATITDNKVTKIEFYK